MDLELTAGNRRRSNLLLWAGCLGVLPWVPALWLPTGVGAQLATTVDSVSAPVGFQLQRSYPDLRKRREIAVSGVGAGFLYWSAP